MAVRVVTDSTAGLSAAVAGAHGITVVPLRVTLGDRSGLEGVDVGPGHVAAALAAHHPVGTSQPSPEAFEQAYAGDGDVLSVHLSAELSGTCAGARIAAARVAGGRVEVLDSRQASMGLGFVVLAAARAAEGGATRAEVTAVAREAGLQTDGVWCLDTAEHARRGGRVGAAVGTAQALVGAALAVKQILYVVDGTLVPLEKVRTSSRALQRLEDLAVERMGDGDAEITVHHLAAPERADTLAAGLDRRLGGRLRELSVSEVGAVLGAHGGPGLLGVVVHRL